MHAFSSQPTDRSFRRIFAALGLSALFLLLAPAVLAMACAQTRSADDAAMARFETRSVERSAAGADGHRLSEIGSMRFAGVENRLTSEQLDRTRGGFSTPGGFDFSFGLTSIRRVNDEPLVTQQLFSVTDVIGGLTQNGMGDPARRAAVSDQPVVLQLGAGNRIARSVLAQRAGIPKTIIQNSLDNQHIRNTNVYDFKLNNVGALTRTLNRNARRAALSQRLVDSIR